MIVIEDVRLHMSKRIVQSKRAASSHTEDTMMDHACHDGLPPHTPLHSLSLSIPSPSPSPCSHSPFDCSLPPPHHTMTAFPYEYIFKFIVIGKRTVEKL